VSDIIFAIRFLPKPPGDHRGPLGKPRTTTGGPKTTVW